MNPKPSVKTQRTAQIIEAATFVFAAKGFDRATMEDIAAQAGINKATIYIYFESKDALIHSIAEELFAQELAALKAAYELPGTAIDRLTAYYTVLIDEETEVLPLMPILYEFYALGLRRADVRKVIAGFITQSVKLLQAIIQDGIESGEFRMTDAGQTARALDALLSGTILNWVYAPEEVDVDEQLPFGVRLIFRGLLNQP